MSNQDTRTLLEKLAHVESLTGTYYSDTDLTYYSDASEVFAALRERLTLEPDPIAELEAMGGFLNIREAGIAWSVLTNEEQDIWLDEPVTSDRDVQLADIRAAAARLLARIRGAK